MSKRGPWPGTWRVICDVCGFEFPSDKLMKRWDGLMVCDKDFEHDHPQKFIRVRPETCVPTYVRPEPPPVFPPDSCDMYNSQGIAGIGVAGCMRAGYNILHLLR